MGFLKFLKRQGGNVGPATEETERSHVPVQNPSRVQANEQRQTNAAREPSITGVPANQDGSQKVTRDSVGEQCTSREHIEADTDAASGPNNDAPQARRRREAIKKFKISTTRLSEIIKTREDVYAHFELSFADSDPISNIGNMAQELEEAISEFQGERDRKNERQTREGKFEASVITWYQKLYPYIQFALSTGTEAAAVRAYAKICHLLTWISRTFSRLPLAMLSLVLLVIY